MSINDLTATDLLHRPCSTPDQLWHWVNTYCELAIPRTPVCPHHNAPFDYLCRAYSEPASDLVVWAPRGGGKTRLAAIATLLDLLHKPRCTVRILGGSFEQSLRMWEHLFPDLEELASRRIASARQSGYVVLDNGASAAVLTQSQRAVRGLRIQKLRCDEVELFKPDIWQAAQLVTRSLAAPVNAPPASARFNNSTDQPFTSGTIAGVVEAISTMHRPFGMMQRIVERAMAAHVPVIRWCLMEVLERCPRQRDCATCALLDDCRGVARERCDGFVTIDDAIRLKSRVSVETWQAEMLCQRPSRRDTVFAHFDPSIHVREEVSSASSSCFRSSSVQTMPPCPPRPSVRASVPSFLRASCPPSSLRPSVASPLPEGRQLSLAIDFGFVNPFVCLWIVTDDDDGITHVIDEYVQDRRTIHEHIVEIRARPWGQVRRIACDPAGSGANDQTAMSNVTVLRQAGFRVLTRRSRIVDGIEMIRLTLRPAAGAPRLFIHPRCPRLIQAMQGYHYDPDRDGELPLKDGQHDHLIDALRYHFVNAHRQPAAGRWY